MRRYRWHLVWASLALAGLLGLKLLVVDQQFPLVDPAAWGVFAFPRDGLSADQQIQKIESQIGRPFGAQRVYSNMNRPPPDADGQARR